MQEEMEADPLSILYCIPNKSIEDDDHAFPPETKILMMRQAKLVTQVFLVGVRMS